MYYEKICTRTFPGGFRVPLPAGILPSAPAAGGHHNAALSSSKHHGESNDPMGGYTARVFQWFHRTRVLYDAASEIVSGSLSSGVTSNDAACGRITTSCHWSRWTTVPSSLWQSIGSFSCLN